MREVLAAYNTRFTRSPTPHVVQVNSVTVDHQQLVVRQASQFHIAQHGYIQRINCWPALADHHKR